MDEIVSASPATGLALGQVQVTNPDKARRIIADAREAAKIWARSDFKQRKRVLRRANDYIHEHFDDIAWLISDENGKPRVEAVTAEITPAMYAIKYYADNAQRILSPEPISMFLWGLAGKSSEIRYAPWGVIGIISPWNYPFGIPMTQIATAVAAGNAVVLKPSSSTALIGGKIGEIWNSIGLPEGLVSVIQGPGPLGEVLIEEKVDRLIFTGSVEIGRHVGKLAADKLIPTTLELGGKDPAIVLKDADLEAATSGILWGAMANAGQTCAGIERVYVESPIFDDFVELLVQKAERLKVGPDNDFDSDVGAITSKGQLKIIEDQVEDARARGARVLTGGRRLDMGEGSFFPPTILVNVNHSMPIVRDETFGPTLPVMPFDSVEEAISKANDSEFGLSASVWTQDQDRAREIAQQLVAGTVTINDSLYTYGLTETPWGGVKHSGIGKTHGKEGLLEMVRQVHIASDRYYRIKKPWWYPYNRDLYDSMKRGLSFLTGAGSGNRSASLFRLLRGLSPRGKI